MKKVIKCFLITSLFTLTQVHCVSLAEHRSEAQYICRDMIKENTKAYIECVSSMTNASANTQTANATKGIVITTWVSIAVGFLSGLLSGAIKAAQ